MNINLALSDKMFFVLDLETQESLFGMGRLWVVYTVHVQFPWELALICYIVMRYLGTLM